MEYRLLTALASVKAQDRSVALTDSQPKATSRQTGVRLQSFVYRFRSGSTARSRLMCVEIMRHSTGSLQVTEMTDLAWGVALCLRTNSGHIWIDIHRVAISSHQ
jgi:hypothetical protein